MLQSDFEYEMGMRYNQLFVTRVNHTLISILYWKFLESNHKNSDFPILTLPVYLTKIFQSLNQCLAQL